MQTIKTAIEATCLLLRIDDIVSGITKKASGGGGAPQMQQSPQVEDADGVRAPSANLIRWIET